MSSPQSGDGDSSHWSPPACEACADVYSGLAKLLQQEGRWIRAVEIPTEQLGPDADEFVRLVRRYRPDVTVFVRARDEQAPRVLAAMRAGARPWSEAALRALVGERLGPSSSLRERVGGVAPRAERASVEGAAFDARATKPASGAASGPARPVGAASASTGLESDRQDSAQGRVGPDERAMGSPDGSQCEEGVGESARAVAESPGETSSSVRVPWVRYSDVPVRRKPPARPAEQPEKSAGEAPAGAGQTPAAKSNDQAGGGPGDPYAPLLSEEELRALMSDDPDEFASEERDALLSEEASGPERAPEKPQR